MKKIATLYEKDIYPKKDIPQNIQYSERITGKAIVYNIENKIALVGNLKNNFFLLPGGGIDLKENIFDGIVRECKEEIGCNIKIINEIGYIDDYRSREKKHYISYCCTAKMIGVEIKTKHTYDEKTNGMFTKWFSFNQALDILEQQKKELEAGRVDFYNTGFNIVRDFLFLKEAKKY